MGRQICILGPIAGVFGRQLEQWLISPDRNLSEEYIPANVILKSINEAQVALKTNWLFDTPKIKLWTKHNEQWDEEDIDSDSQLKEKKAKLRRGGHGSDRYTRS